MNLNIKSLLRIYSKCLVVTWCCGLSCFVFSGFSWHHLSPLCSAGCAMCEHCSEWAISIHVQRKAHKCLLCSAQVNANKNLLLSVNERPKQRCWSKNIPLQQRNYSTGLKASVCQCVWTHYCICLIKISLSFIL